MIFGILRVYLRLMVALSVSFYAKIELKIFDDLLLIATFSSDIVIFAQNNMFQGASYQIKHEQLIVIVQFLSTFDWNHTVITQSHVQNLSH